MWYCACAQKLEWLAIPGLEIWRNLFAVNTCVPERRRPTASYALARSGKKSFKNGKIVCYNQWLYWGVRGSGLGPFVKQWALERMWTDGLIDWTDGRDISPTQTVSLLNTTVTLFKSRLDTYWQNQEIVHSYKEPKVLVKCQGMCNNLICYVGSVKWGLGLRLLNHDDYVSVVK